MVTGVTSDAAAGGAAGPAWLAGAPRGSSPPGLPEPGRCLVMGVVNVTPDSFSDGGEWFGTDVAIARGRQLAAQGADIVDVGGESTRPGAQRIPAAEELRRVVPVIAGLAAHDVPVSVDTMRAEVAEAALEVGARLVNDVSGGLADPEMPRLVGRVGIPYVVMHWRGHSHRMEERAVYADVVAEVCEELRRRVDAVWPGFPGWAGPARPSPCWSARRASASSAGSLPPRTAPRARSRAPTTPRSP
jgi:hypothetical protein